MRTGPSGGTHSAGVGMGPGYRLKFRPRLRRLVRDLSWEAAAGASLGNGVTERGSGATSGIAAVAVAGTSTSVDMISDRACTRNAANATSSTPTHAIPVCLTLRSPLGGAPDTDTPLHRRVTCRMLPREGHPSNAGCGSVRRAPPHQRNDYLGWINRGPRRR